jgi:methylamine---glutamate N-methyltransferase subunit A
MCGIVGLFLKNSELEPELGRLTAAMLTCMCARGPDSAGFAIYSDSRKGFIKLTLRGPAGTNFSDLSAPLVKTIKDVETTVHDSHAVLNVRQGSEKVVLEWLAREAPYIDVVGRGLRMELYKEVGWPETVVRRFDLPAMRGTHAIGHTRMATESAVTIDGAHPYSTGIDQCLVHNGSLSNHNGVRRILSREGFAFETENDTEVAAGYLTWRMRQGLTLGEALKASLDDLDGFYTFVVGTENGFGVLRDGIACKPAVMAETNCYVAFGTEYRALAGLPGVAGARIFEPDPATVYFWER